MPDRSCSVASCSVEGCKRTGRLTRGYCGGHYQRWRATGDTGSAELRKTKPPTRNLVDRIAANIEIDPESGCWLWTGTKLPNGYAVVPVTRSQAYAHRASYEAHVGPIPHGFEIDHICHTNDADCREGDDCPHRSCVNPEHLEPVTRRENALRGHGFIAENAAKTHCPQEHEYTVENTYVKPNGTRRCRRCNIEASVRYRKKKSLL